MQFPRRNPLGYKNLLSWQQACQIYDLTKEFAATLPKIHPKTGQSMYRLVNHMVDSARSVKRNIEEGHRRQYTHEYIQFLGYSLGSLEELNGDYEDCRKDKIGNQEIIKKVLPLLHGEDKLLCRQRESLERKRRGISRGNQGENFVRWLEEISGLKRLLDGRFVPKDHRDSQK